MRLYRKLATAEQLSEGVNLTGQTALVTGCDSGLGLETMRVLSLRGAQVIGMARSLKQAKGAIRSVQANAIPVAADLSDPQSVVKAAAAISNPIDMLIANAGVMALQTKEIVHGFEKHLLINHLSQALLISQLQSQLSPTARLVIVSSAAHGFARGKGIDFDDLEWKRPYKPWTAYGQSKLANILYTQSLAARLHAQQTVNCLHPGIIDSPLWRHVPEIEAKKMIGTSKFISIEQGAACSVALAIGMAGQTVTGQYFSSGELKLPSKTARDESLMKELSLLTEAFIARYD